MVSRSRSGNTNGATGWTADDLGLDSGQGQYFSALHVIQTGSGAHPAYYPMGTGGDFPGLKRPGSEADRSPPSSTEIKNGAAISPSPPPYVFMAYCLIN
jgi:hypothetical protein